MSIYDVTVIGVGRLGGALALALSKNGYKINQLVVRNSPNAERVSQLIVPPPKVLTLEEFDGILSDIIFITTQDSEIIDVAQKLSENLEQLPLVFHTSGALSSEILLPLQKIGCKVASFHPLVSVSDSLRGIESFKNAYFCLEGDTEAVFIGTKIVETLGGKAFSIETKFKPLYHAAAVTACGHVVTLISLAIEMFANCGIEENEAQKILFPLIKSTINNLSNQKPAEALTGTFARADLTSLESHLIALRESVSEEILETYLQLGQHSLELALIQGADPPAVEAMSQVLKQNKGK
jgi:predicted short-subunit dehydrogenase-like oxidoreductase (DUF2520 family)